MTSTKSPKARHSRLLSNGFFPPEMPACFYSNKLGVERDKLLAEFQNVPARGKIPAYQMFQGQIATFNFPRLNREDRRHSYINPVSYFYLSKIIAEKYVALRKLNRRSKISLAPTIFDWSGERALIRPGFEARDSQRITLSANHALLAEADIAAFFHSVYTHVIPWAIHGKKIAKGKKRDMTLFGNELDLLVRNAQDGQTIGLPVGPDTSRVLAEVIGTALDKTIQSALSSKRIWNVRKRGAMRFVDDFTFGCSSVQEAEIVVSSVRRCVNEFELEINNSKTKIFRTGPFFRPHGKSTFGAFSARLDQEKVNCSVTFTVSNQSFEIIPNSMFRSLRYRTRDDCFWRLMNGSWLRTIYCRVIDKIRLPLRWWLK